MFFADRYLGFDDAIYASFRLLEIIDRENKGIGELLRDLPTSCGTPEIRIDCPDQEKFRVVDALARHFRQHYKITDVDVVRANHEIRISRKRVSFEPFQKGANAVTGPTE